MLRSTSNKFNNFEQFRSWLSNNRFSVTTIILVVGLVAFEMFNYSTTDFALSDLLGDLRFVGIKWSTILAVAFCGIDFAGIARLFMPEEQQEAQREVWFLFAAWLLAATMNAILTWWGVSMSLVSHSVQSTAIVDAATIQQIVPVFVAIMVWLTRILLIGSFSFSNKFQTARASKPAQSNRRSSRQTQPAYTNNSIRGNMQTNPVQMQSRSTNTVQARPKSRIVSRPEPEYISEPGSAATQASFNGSKNNNQVRRF